MADYKVGNLQIVFDTLDQTQEGFKKLATDLRAVQKAIAKIGSTDLNPFVANMKQVVKAFNPLLTNIGGASDAIIALNQSIQKVGARNLSRVAKEFGKVKRASEGAINSVENFSGKINELNNNVLLLGLGSSLQEMRGGTAGYNWVGDYALQVQGAIKYSDEFRESVIRLAEQMILSRKVYDESSASMNKLASQWKNLYANVIQYGNQYGEGFVGKANEELAQLQQQYFQMRTVVDDTNNAFREMEEIYRRSRMSAEELTIEEYRNIEAKNRQRIEFLQASLAMGTAGKNTNAYKKELAKLTNEQNKNAKTTKKSTSGFGKLFASIKRIALYRLIRSALKAITSSLTETAKAFAQVDDGVNDTMSKLTSSLSIIKISFGATLLPLLQAIEPIITQIAVAFGNLANMVSQAMSTTGYYTEINTEAIKNYRDELGKAGSLLDFDKFRVLNKQAGSLSDFLIPNQKVKKEYADIGNTIDSLKNSITNIGSILSDISGGALQVIADILKEIAPILEKVTGWVSDIFETLDELGLIEPILWGIVTALAAISAIKIFTWLANGSIIKWIGAVISLLKYDFSGTIKMLAGDLVKAINTVKGQFVLWGIAVTAVLSAIQILSNWDEFSRNTKIAITVISTLIAALTSAAVAAMALHGALTVGSAVPLIVTSISAGAIAINGFIKGFADGGIPNTGTLFYAGEAGAETVTVGRSGRTEVTNVNQMEEALYNALVRYGRENRGSDTPIKINIDGRPVFEVVRKEARKNGLEFSKVR